MTSLDKNSDARIDGDEIKGSPGLAAGVRSADANGDGNLSADELEAQFTKYRDQRVGLQRAAFQLVYKGKPVPNAEVRFIPEPYLEGVVTPASGTTDIDGVVLPHVDGEQLPGMQLGYYRVQVISSTVNVPEKYSSADSPLGADVSLVDATSYGMNSVVRLELTD
ncbi:MAG: hypothetical protein DCC67_04515 [Planctomycetota bacterium]|nr:MAG: hypothetical protein DCC67_04515 [Planctomycetota bacterium]